MHIRPDSFKTLLLATLLATLGFGAALPAATIVQAQEPSLGLEEVVVTARRIEESLQDVPIAVSVLTGADLNEQGGLKIDTIGKIAPNVHFESAGGTSGVKSPEIFIRGMGQSDFIPVEDPAVGVYLDGVYLGRNIGSVFDLIDVERIEVLRGPQGTLFGRNTIGGALNIVSKSPGDEFEGSVRAAIGDEGFYQLNGTVNVPFGDAVAGRFSAFIRERDGYVKALQYDDLELGSDDIFGLRASFRANISDSFTAELAFDYSKAEETPGAVTPVSGIGSFDNTPLTYGPAQPFANFHNTIYSRDAASCTTAAGQATNTACYGPVWNTGDMYSSNAVFVNNDGDMIVPEQSVEVMGGNLTLSWELGNVTLKSISSYREFDIHLFNDLDFSPYILFANNHDEYTQDQISQEFQVQGSAMDGRLDYVLGFYYFEEEAREAIFNQITFPPPALIDPASFFFQYVDRMVDNDSKALFGQLNYDITDALTLTLGARRTISNKHFDLITTRAAGDTVQFGDLETKETTPLLSLSWDVSDNIMLFATYSEGYRDGSWAARFTGEVPTPLPNYDPEYVTNYEIGMKSTLADNRVRLNVSAFSMDYEDMQISAASDEFSTSSTKANLGEATIRGLEAELTAVAAEGLTVGVNLGYLDDEIDSLIGTLISNGVVIGEDNDLAMTPDWTLTLMARYEISLNNGAAFSIRADYSAKDDYMTRAENVQESLIDNFRNLNLNATYVSPDSAWEASIGVRNATDQKYYQSVTPFSSFGLTFGQPVRPRTVFAAVQYNFGS